MQYHPVFRVTSTQHGLITREQALNIVTRSQFERLVHNGLLERITRGVYRVAGTPVSWNQRVQAGVLTIPTAVAAHRSAGRLHGLAIPHTARVEILVPTGMGRHLAGITVRESNNLCNTQLMTSNGIACTTVPRTIVDLGGLYGITTLHRVVADALDRHLATIGQLQDVAKSLKARGRQTVRINAVLADFALDPAVESALERSAVRRLRLAALPLPHTQYPVVASGHRYRLDLAYPAVKLGVELDGLAAHGGSFAFHHDRRRDVRLQQAGWTVLRFTSQTMTDLVPAVRRQLANSSTSPPALNPPSPADLLGVTHDKRA